MAVDRFSPLDASFLHIENEVSHMHLGAILVFEGPPPTYEAFSSTVAAKLSRVPRFRQVVRTVPLHLGRPVWVDDRHFNLGYHLRHTALPSPGGMPELRRLVGRVMGQQLDRSRPLWEMWMVEGLEDGEWALISKTHHAMVDGVSGADLLASILDVTVEVDRSGDVPWAPTPAPSRPELAGQAMVEMARSPFEQARALRRMTRLPRRAVHEVADVAAGVWATAGLIRPRPGSSINGPLGPHRRWVTADTTVADIKTVRRAFGGTFNDVVLAAITQGYRDLLLGRGESVERPLRTMVPVSVRARNDRGMAVGDGDTANKVSAIFADLPVGLDDPVAALGSISAQMQGLKDSRQAMAGEALTSLGGFAPPMLLAIGGRLGTRLSLQRQVNTLTTNVPGPQIPLYAVGRRMVRSYPYAPLGIGLRVGTAIFSYDGKVTFGVTADFDTNADIEVLTDGITAGMKALVAAAERRPGGEEAPAPARRKPRPVLVDLTLEETRAVSP
jgi:diacylglycerol O-acyltransferase